MRQCHVKHLLVGDISRQRAHGLGHFDVSDLAMGPELGNALGLVPLQ